MPLLSLWRVTAGGPSAIGNVELQVVLSQQEKGSLRPEKKNATSWPEEVSHMAVSSNLDEPHLRNTGKPWVDDVKYRDGRLFSPSNSEWKVLPGI